MKLKISKKYINKILQLNLLKLRLYKKNELFNSHSKTIKLTLKKTLNIIYEYCINKKKILFLGFPNSFQNILKHTKHILIPNVIFYTNVLDDKIIHSNNFKTIFQGVNISLDLIRILLKLNKKTDLIVIYNLSNRESLIQKNYKLKIPIIYCFNEFNKFDSKIAYNTIVNKTLLNKKIFHYNLILSMIKTTLKKARISKKNLLDSSFKSFKKTSFNIKHSRKRNSATKYNKNRKKNKYKYTYKYTYTY